MVVGEGRIYQGVDPWLLVNALFNQMLLKLVLVPFVKDKNGYRFQSTLMVKLILCLKLSLRVNELRRLHLHHGWV